MKKVRTTWSRCPKCQIIISDRFIKRHENDHNRGGTTSTPCVEADNSDTVVKTPNRFTPGRANSQTTNEYGYFVNETLLAVVTTTKMDAEPELPKSIRDEVAYLSIGTMRVGCIGIGDVIVVNNRFCYYAWPNSTVPDCHIYLPTRGRLCNAGVTPGLLCNVNLASHVVPADLITYRFEDSETKLPESIDDEALSSFLCQQMYKRMVIGNCTLELSYFGKPVPVRIVGVSGRCSVTPTDALTSDLSQLDITNADSMTTPKKASDSNPVLSTPKMSTPSSQPHGQLTSTPKSAGTLLQYDGLGSSPTIFYQVNSNTSFRSVGGHSEATVGVVTPINSTEAPADNTSVLAGVDDLLSLLNELIVEPISRRDDYHKYGVKVPKGALLYGPPGCGKTLIAQCIGRKLNGLADFVTLDSSQLWSKQFGETENRLQKIFQQAVQRSPSVIFIDDIDVMCPRRERSQSDLEKRVLSSLVCEIDQIKDKYVFILATTNKLDSVDMTLRRPGRLDREIEVPVPSSKQRQQIISALLSPMLSSLSEQEVSAVAADCHGYVGADLQHLCREAGLNAMRLSRPCGVTLDDFKFAMTQIQPSAMREIYIDVPKVKWDDIGGQTELKQKLTQAIVWPLQFAERFQRLGIKPPRGVLMYGPPGCSKTMTAKALATETSLNFISIKGPELFSKWVGESEKAVRDVFRKARSAAPSIVFFDEIDAIAVERGRQQSAGGGVGDRVLAQLLTELDGVEGLNGVNIVAATNRPDMIDKALTRPGRLDRLVYVPLPDEQTRKEIFRLRLEDMPLNSDVDISELVQMTNLYSGAEVTAVCNEAAIEAMQEDINSVLIHRKHFITALSSVKPQTTPSMVTYYEDFSAKSASQ